jgi:hypothetical protein
MKKKLREEDKLKIKKTNLLRFSKEWYLIANLVAVTTYLYAFLMPYLGWRRKPIYVPVNFDEYIKAVLKMHLFLSPLLALVGLNFLIRIIEIKRGYILEKRSSVLLKRKIWKHTHIIIFKPLYILFFSNKFKYNDIEEHHEVLIETTSLGRFLNYKQA